MSLPIYQIDAFAREAFKGNPAAVMPLQSWLPDDVMQKIALENNLAETAFFVPVAGDTADYHLRWFTPELEIPLCGHATLASAFVIWKHLGFSRDMLRFSTQTAGPLSVTRQGERIALDFPSYPCAAVDIPGLAGVMGATPREVLQHSNYVIARFATAADVAALIPDFAALKKLHIEVIATAPGKDTVHDCDFVSRFFAPGVGVNEDPVTGSAHCRLIPYWAEKLGKTDMFARQISARSGELWCRLRGDRVEIAGYATEVLRGMFIL
jgi:PhzF family phenazine biosynthesis protein